MPVKLTLGGPASNKPPSPEPEPSEDHYPQKLTLNDGRVAWVSLPWPDKLSLVGTIYPEDFNPPKGSHAEIDHELISTIGSFLATDMQGAWKLTKSTKGYRTVVLTMGDDDATVRFDFTKIKGEWRLRLELNPRRLGKTGADAFCQFLDYYAPNDFALARFLSKAHLTRIDVATDIVGIPIFDLLVTVENQGKRATYTGEDGQLETIYVFRRKSPKTPSDTTKTTASKLKAMVMAYDKVRELASRNLPPPFGPAPVTRVEVVKQHFGSIKVRLSELQSLANPLSNVRVGYAHNTKIGGATWGGYVGLRRTIPAMEAGRLIGLGAKTAGAFEAAMQDHPSDLMVHETLWTGWKSALAETGLGQIIDHIEKLAGQKIVSGKTDY